MHPDLAELIDVCVKHEVGHVVLAGGSKGSPSATPTTAAVTTTAAPDLTTAPTTTEETTTTTTTASQTAHVFGDSARLRPSTDPLGTTKLVSLTINTELTILDGPDADGWYHVQALGQTGYLFGAFVMPPAPGWCVATSYAPKPTYHDENFTEIVRTVNAGNKALLTSGIPGPAGYPAVLPDHQRGYVSQSEVQIVDCG